MNRLVIIGNGFDLAHGLKTSYKDFINKAKLFESVCKIGARVEGIRDLPFFEQVQKDERLKVGE